MKLWLYYSESDNKTEEHGDLRDVVLLLLNTACRLNEILSLQWNWIGFERRVIHLPEWQTKNEEERDVKLNQLCISLLRQRRLRTVSDVYVFPSDQSESGHVVSLYRQWYKALKKSGITDLELHDLRHTCASRLSDLNVHSAVIRDVLGHKSFTVTSDYIHPDGLEQALHLLQTTYFATKEGEKTA